MRQMFLVCFGLFLGACAPKDTVVLLDSVPGSSGHAVIDGKMQARTLTAPGETVDLSGADMATRISTPEEVERVYGRVFPPPTAARTYIILFDTGKQALPLEADAVIQAFLADVAANPPAEVQITGHTDSVGSLESNDHLSKTRAVAVRDALILRGLKAALIRTVGRGERSLFVKTPDETSEPRNRIVEIVVR